MKFAWKVVIGITSVLLVLYIISFFLPSEFQIERSVQINAPAATVFDEVVNLQNWPAWSPFDLQDTAVTTSFSAISSGKSAWMEWTDSRRSDGRITIVSLAAGKTIDLAIEFGDFEPEAGPVNSSLQFVAESAGSSVVWNFHGNASGALERYLVLFIDGQMGARFENSLNQLKQRVETSAP